MKHLGIFILGALLLASCATNKRAAYIQQVQTDIPTAIEQDYQIRIKPLDRLTVTINSWWTSIMRTAALMSIR